MSGKNRHFRPVGKRKFFTPPEHVRMAREFGVPPAECKAAIRRMDPWCARTNLVPFLAGALVLCVCIGIGNLIPPALEAFAPEAYEWMRHGQGRLVVPWLGPAVALLLVVGVYGSVRTRFLRRGLRKRLTAHWCIHCGYDLAGLPKAPPGVTCPECGKPSPVADTSKQTGRRPRSSIAGG